MRRSMKILDRMICATSIACIIQRSVHGFSPSFTRRSTNQCVRYLSSSGMPYSDDKMPFYALGTNMAVQIAGQGNIKSILDDDEMEVLLQGFCDTMSGNGNVDPRMVLTKYGPSINAILQEKTKGLADKVKQDGKQYLSEFLEDNRDAIQTNSGLVYFEMKAGQGMKPTLQSTVEVHYHGTLTDGTVFDSSVERGQTISFPLGGVIKGWQEGLAMMKEGGKATLVIPADLAYGEAGSGDVIPPGATLRFEVELFKVQDK